MNLLDIKNGRTNISLYEEYPELFIPSSMNINNDSQCIEKVINEVKQFYFKDTNVTDPYSWIMVNSS